MRAAISLTSFPATAADSPLGSLRGLSSTRSAPASGASMTLDDAQSLTDGEAARLPVGDSRGQAGLDRVQVERQVHRHVEAKRHAVTPGGHLDHFHPEPLRLLALVSRHRPDSDLDQAVRQALFHDPGERTRMGVRVSLEVVVQVGMGVEVQDAEAGVVGSHPAQRGVGDRVVAAEQQRPAPGIEDGSDRLLDARPRVGARLAIGEPEVALVLQPPILEIETGLGPGVPRLAPERLPDQHRARPRGRAGTRIRHRTGPPGEQPWSVSCRGHAAVPRPCVAHHQWSPPRCIRRSTARYPSTAAGSGASSETAIPARNESGMVISAGFLSGNQAASCWRMSTWIVGDR